ncbi:hypothetical protein KZX50_16980 [Bacillus infantis]|uniref:hypothetical protein n=1 Tax=Bacillus infantis TaxID=324767 RepID=UPI002005BECD|nr:hypothetical protein [Bacillus infantis]MCK6207134.1 hypothetical protein [Bacillus infantis]
MTMKEVINEGEKITMGGLPWNAGYNSLTVMLCVVIGIALIGIVYTLFRSKVHINMMLLSVSILLFAAVTGMTLKEIHDLKTDVYNEQVTEWREGPAREFVDRLPVSQKEINLFDIDDLETLNKYTRNWWQINYSNYDDEFLTLVEYSLDDDNDGDKPKEGWFEVVRDLESDEEPYVEYQELKESLGHGVNKGMYNMVIHVPED